MIVCICHRVSDRDIVRVVRQGCASFEALQDELLVASGCGACLDFAENTFARACAAACLSADAAPSPLHRQALAAA